MAFPLRYRTVKNPIGSNRVLDAFQIIITAGLCAFSPALALAQQAQTQQHIGYKTIYKSVGKFGETKYSQFAPETGSKAQVIEMRSDGQPSQPGLLAPISSDQISEDLTGNNQNPPVPTSKSSGPNAATASQCQKLNNNLSNLQAGGDIYESKSGGERYYLNPVEVAVKIEDTQKLLAQYCKNPL